VRILDLLITGLCQMGELRRALEYAPQEVELRRRLSAGSGDIAVQESYIRALGRLGELLDHSGRPADALTQFDLAEAAIDAGGEITAEDRANLCNARGSALLALGQHRAAADAWLRAAALWQTLPDTHPSDPVYHQVTLLHNAAVALAKDGDFARSAALLNQANALVSPALRRDQPDLVATVMQTLVMHLVGADQHREAVQAARSIDLADQRLDKGYGFALQRAAAALSERGERDLAIEGLQRAAAVLRPIAQDQGADASDVAGVANLFMELSADLARAGRFDEGAQAAREAATIWRTVMRALPNGRYALALTLVNLGSNLRASGRTAEAVGAFSEAVGEFRQLVDFPTDFSGEMGGCLLELAWCQVELGAGGLAVAAGEEASRLLGGPGSASLKADALHVLTRARWLENDAAMAVHTHNEEIRVRVHLAKHDPLQWRKLTSSMADQVRDLLVAGDVQGALAESQRAGDVATTAYGPNPTTYEPEFVRMLIVRGTALLEAGRAAESVEPLARGIAMAGPAGQQPIVDYLISQLRIAARADPAGVAAVWRHITGDDLPPSIAPHPSA
jgi:tetratricopeptide (TPR) repeat protein